jgi:hypothetical protein
MTAKTKAKELMAFFDKIHYNHDKEIAYTFDHITIEERKIMVLQLCNEYLNTIDGLFMPDSIAYNHWTEVKKEIEKL